MNQRQFQVVYLLHTGLQVDLSVSKGLKLVTLTVWEILCTHIFCMMLIRLYTESPYILQDVTFELKSGERVGVGK